MTPKEPYLLRLFSFLLILLYRLYLPTSVSGSWHRPCGPSKCGVALYVRTARANRAHCIQKCPRPFRAMRYHGLLLHRFMDLHVFTATTTTIAAERALPFTVTFVFVTVDFALITSVPRSLRRMWSDPSIETKPPPGWLWTHSSSSYLVRWFPDLYHFVLCLHAHQ